MKSAIIVALGVVSLAAPALAADPLQLTSRTLVERRVAAADGTTRIVASATGRAAPGDRLVVELAYRNIGQRPLADVVLADPVPAALAYRAPAPGTPVPEVSIDGSHFAALADLVVARPGGSRPAVADDVVAVRWRLSGALAAGASGTLSFRAVLR